MLTILTQPSGGKSRRKSLRFKVFLDKKIDIGEIDQKNEKIINLGEPTSAKDAATKDFVEKSHVFQSGLQQNVFLYQMTDDLESSSESNITVTGIKDFANTPHTLFKKGLPFHNWEKCTKRIQRKNWV